MGIKNLWSFLNPYCERKPLYELQGKIVAIDLAGWICESLCVVDYEVQAKFYLRNLFFRTCFLLLSGITPIFVLEGTAPAIKHQMIARRNQIQFRGAKPRCHNSETNSEPAQPESSKGRTRFNYVLRQCEELIRSMGLQCMQGSGEAEAFCAHLNARGIVDGVVSQDSDCFAYGARRVFRNFTLSVQGSAGSIGGSVDIYDLDIVERSVDFGRNKIIVMALLCGCDYSPEGVDGVGKDAVQKLFSIYAEKEILDKIRTWRINDSKFTELEIKVDDKKLCTSCGHYGRVQNHRKKGCTSCKMHVGCDSTIWKERRSAIKTELQIRKKAMSNEDFPSEDIIGEFLREPINFNVINLKWCQPNIIKFIRMMGSTLQWNEIYCFQKFLPLLTRWQLHQSGDESNVSQPHGNVEPDFIKKKRAPKGVPSYEIIWKDSRKQFVGLIPKNQMETHYSSSESKDKCEAEQVLWSTIEPVDLVNKAYPELVERFLLSKLKKRAKKNEKDECSSNSTEVRMKICVTNMDEDSNKIEGIPALKYIPKENPKSKKELKSKKIVKWQTTDAFLRRERSHPSKMDQSPKIKTSSKPMNLSVFASELTDSFSISMHEDNMDLSNIIDEVVSRVPPIEEVIGKRLRFDDIQLSSNKDIHEPSQTINEHGIKGDNNVSEEIMGESFDDFDLLVMHKDSKDNSGNLKDSMNNICSTPSSKIKNKNDEDACVVSISNKSANQQTTQLFSSFFNIVNPNDEVDLFEKSVDFRNMEDLAIEEENGEK